MFKLNTKHHNMNLRITEKYKTTKAKTERFKRSAIPYMVRLLNKNHQDKARTPPSDPEQCDII